MLKDEDYLKIIAWLMGIGGIMSGVIGGLVAYIFKEHVKDNNKEFSRNDHEHEKFDERMRDGGI